MLSEINTRMLTGEAFDRWEATYTAVQAGSASWESGSVPNYDSTYTTVQTNSSGWSSPYTQNLGFAVSDETTNISTDTGMTFRMPIAFIIEDIRASVTTAPSGSPIIIDITKNGTSIFAVNSGISIDSGEKTSTTATSAYGLTASSIAADDEIIIDVTQVGSTAAGAGLKIYFVGQTGQYQTFIIACSNETSNLATGTSVATFRTPFSYNITDVRASLTTPSSGSDIIVDVNSNGESMFSTLLYIDAGETTSTTATSSVAITGSSIPADTEISVDIDQVGSVSQGTGLKVYLIGTKT